MCPVDAHDPPPGAEPAALGLLQRIAVVANEASSLAAAIQAALDEVCAQTGWPVGHAYLTVGDALAPTGIWHFSDRARFEAFRAVTEATPLPAGAGLPGRILVSGRPAWIADVTSDPNFPRARAVAELGVRGAFGFPLLASRRVAGVLEFFSEEPQAPDQRLLDLMAYVGTQLGRVAEREASAAALVAQVDHTRLLIDSAYDAFVSIDGDGRITGWNTAAEAMFGWARDEAIGRMLAETIVPSAHRRAHRRGIARFHATGEGPILNQRLEVTAMHRDGREFPIELAVWPVVESGRYTFSAFIRDITERKQSGDALARLAAIVESSEDAMLTKSLDGTILSWNRGAEHLYGYTADEAVGRQISLISPPDLIEELAMIMRRVANGESLVHFETVRQAKDGRLIDVSLTISPITDSSDKVVAAASISRDISKQKRAARRLRDSERRLLTAQQISGIGSWEWDIERDVVTWSPQLYRNYGLDDLGFEPSFAGFLTLVHPDDREHVRSVVAEALETREPFRMVHRGPPDEAGRARYFLGTGEVITTAGRVVSMAGTNEDITDRKRAEDALKEAFERERATVEKLRELDQAKTIFTSSVSHELRTPLTSIIGYLDLLRELEGEKMTRTQREMLAVVERNSNRLLELIEDLLTFSRLQGGTFRPSIGPVRLADMFASAREAVLPQITAESLDIDFVDPNGLEVMGDAAQLDRVLLNLLSNAIKFTPSPGSISVAADRDGDNVVITVQDTGIGIPPSDVPSLFSPFFRSSNAEARAIPGTGLGLAIVKTIVDGHDGTIELAPGEDHGTVVRVRLPAAHRHIAEAS